MDGARVPGGEVQRGFRAGGFEHGIAVAFEHLTGDAPHRRLVLDHQDRLRSARGARRQLRGLGRALGQLLDARQVELEGGALADLAVHPDESTALLDDAVHGGEPQPRALAFLLGREERLEHVGLGFFAHPNAGVRDREHHKRSRARGVVVGGVRVVQIHVGRLQGELAPVRHRVAGVHGQVHDYLLELAGIGLDPPRGGCEPRAERDVFAQEAAQHLLQVADQRVDLEHGRLQDLLAAERQQLAGQPGGAIGGLVDLIGVLTTGIGGAEVLEQEIRVAGDGREDVVEVVGNAARQAADRFHLLGLAQLLLELDALRDVAPDAQDADEPALVELRSRGKLSDAEVAFGGADAELAGGAELAAHHPPEQLERERQILRVHQSLERLPHPLLAPPAGDRRERGVEGGDRAFGREREDDVPHPLDQRAVPFLGLPQRRFGGAALRDVAEVQHDGAHRRLGEAVDRDRVDMAPRAVLVTPAELQAGRGARARDDVAQGGMDPRHVVGMHPFEPGMTHQLGRREAEQALDRVAGEEDGPVGGDEGDRVRTVLDQRAKALLALATGLFRAGLLGPRAPQIEGAHHGGAHPLEVVLDDVVGGAGLDVLRRGFFVEAARHDDDGRVRRLEERDAQRVGGAERGQGVVREDDVGGEGLERLPVRRLGVDPAGRPPDAGPAQLPLDQRGVVGDVLDHQDAHQVRHRLSAAARSRAASRAPPRKRRARRPRSPRV